MIPLGADRMTMRPSAPWGGRRRGTPRRPLAVPEGRAVGRCGRHKGVEKNRGKTWKIYEKNRENLWKVRIFQGSSMNFVEELWVWHWFDWEKVMTWGGKTWICSTKIWIVSLFRRGVNEKRNILTNVSYWSSVHTPKKGWANDDGCVQGSKNRDYQPFSTNQKGAGLEDLLDFQHINWSHFSEMSVFREYGLNIVVWYHLRQIHRRTAQLRLDGLEVGNLAIAISGTAEPLEHVFPTWEMFAPMIVSNHESSIYIYIYTLYILHMYIGQQSNKIFWS